MKAYYIKFLASLSVNKLGRAGVVITTSAFITFLFLEFLRFIGVYTNAYFGLITYLALPSLFVIGLLLIPTGWYMFRSYHRREFSKIIQELESGEFIPRKRFGSKLFQTILVLSLVNVFFLIFASMRTLSFMDDAEFCGTACHSVMNPEWEAYKVSPHSRVACVECHVGEGVGALIDSKINGAWQVISLTFNLYERPIPTPVHQLRPSRETCEKCHWPEKFYGSKIKTFVNYGEDEFSTPKYSTLVLKIDAGENVGNGGIHWHINSNNEIRYSSVEDKREEIIWVEVKQSDGSYKRFNNSDYLNDSSGNKFVRQMDCVDCHNRATHIYEDPETAVDERLRKGLIDRSLPFIKREALSALTSSFTNSDKADEIILNRLNRFYSKNYPDIALSKSVEIDKAINEIQNTYNTNIHYEMGINWNSYPNHLNHKLDKGCFRCHNSKMKDEQGKAIKNECTTCHSMLSNDSATPFEFLRRTTQSSKDSLMKIYLLEEFMESFN